MPEVNPLSVMTFATPKELAQWLKLNHAIESELWIKIFKKNSGVQSVSWNDVVIEVLCWGWIDGVKKSIDEQAYYQRITPRTARSNWSKKNRKHVEDLIGNGRMMESGLVHVRAAKADGRWESAYVVSEMTVPKVKKFYSTLNKSDRYVIAYGLTSAKKAETRARRFAKYMTMLTQEEKPK